MNPLENPRVPLATRTDAADAALAYLHGVILFRATAARQTRATHAGATVTDEAKAGLQRHAYEAVQAHNKMLELADVIASVLSMEAT